MGSEIEELTKELEIVKAEEQTLLSLKEIISNQLHQLEMEEVALREIISLEQQTRSLCQGTQETDNSAFSTDMTDSSAVGLINLQEQYNFKSSSDSLTNSQKIENQYSSISQNPVQYSDQQEAYSGHSHTPVDQDALNDTDLQLLESSYSHEQMQLIASEPYDYQLPYGVSNNYHMEIVDDTNGLPALSFDDLDPNRPPIDTGNRNQEEEELDDDDDDNHDK